VAQLFFSGENFINPAVVFTFVAFPTVYMENAKYSEIKEEGR
jgi:hypothetical protein